ncbi:MAG: hypothetical protein HOU81_02050 [Hamadaea sp.]|uniref:hypothetical protein n=1 Tax=Hamadaea sp. TaxID=2024425 RepID=UPI00182D9E47|nr:hypothetical protein [Hamadaea sp.]NUR69580.1 hypothetical protein [Hamadaea sp.]NUT20308.1 hypothetical protein [Hamadaea sp.]
MGRIARAPMQWFLYGVGGLALAVSAAFGGFAPVEKTEPVLKVGEVNAGTPWNVKITAVRLVKDLEPQISLKDKADHWLAVIAEVEITDVESRHDIRDIVLAKDIPGVLHYEFNGNGPELAREVVVTSDGTRVEALHPGLTEKVAFLWEVKPDSVPTKIEVEIMGKTYRESSLTGLMEWLDLAPRAVLTVPVEDKRNG